MLLFQPTYTISDMINTLLFVLAILGLYFTIHQIRQSYVIQKATFFKELYLTLLTDSDIKDAFYIISHSKFTYDGSFTGSQVEKSVDGLLCFLDVVCGLYANKMLTKQEMYYFEYGFRKVYINPNVQTYLEDLRKAFKSAEADSIPFASFVSYCQNELRMK